MRLGKLLEHLSRYQPDDVISIAIWRGSDYETTAIGQILHGEGIALLATPETDAYQRKAREAEPSTAGAASHRDHEKEGSNG